MRVCCMGFLGLLACWPCEARLANRILTARSCIRCPRFPRQVRSAPQPLYLVWYFEFVHLVTPADANSFRTLIDSFCGP
ncbi:hypothetical protein Micbo1qcDRAFT_70685 [Microdochium bolleyi]|uniref:Secreted protein n=1 Tax=Microdochium bolleyi TaxID=196109 RepID=A0A136IZS6_9PEZI|nr:hypothetical protein Micbo1qcDRAFT_70685 [Microdochium bolleyi]